MITYTHEKEKIIAFHYAKVMNDEISTEIINTGIVKNKEEAAHLSEFFWNMVDASVEDIDKGVVVCGQKDLSAWNEFTMNSFRSYLRANGYADEWEHATDQA